MPNQMFSAQTKETTSCCEVAKKEKCCDDEKKSDSHDQCKDKCCSTCHSCTHTLVFKQEKIYSELSTLLLVKKELKYSYSTENSSSISYQIWQPPKIA